MDECAADVDESGQVVAQFTYDAWGNVLSSSYFLPITSYFPSFSLRYLFQGREYSFATGLYNFRARWYEPRLGRWLSNDPIGISGGLNLYAFCGNDPVNQTDPFGLSYTDTVNMGGSFFNTLNTMNSVGQRYPGTGSLAGNWNNLILPIKGYNGCRSQALIMLIILQQSLSSYDDEWCFERVKQGWKHYVIRAQSTNPLDPVLILDPWKGTITLGAK